LSTEVSHSILEAQNVPLIDLMRLLEAEGYSSTVVVRNEQIEGRIKFSIGVPVSAVCGPKSAEDAVSEMLSWPNPKIALSPMYNGNEIPITTPLQKLLKRKANASTPGSKPESKTESKLEPTAANTVINETKQPKGEKHNTPKTTSIQSKPQTNPIRPHTSTQGEHMSNINEILTQCMQIDGAVGVALADYSSGMALGMLGGNGLNLEVAAAGNTDVVRSKLRVMKELGLKDQIDDILITLGTQYHLIRLLPKAPNLFVYIALDRTKANLAMARHKLASLTDSISL
jgi:Domain of unknown function (DUF4388)